jgi:hypothetical protein
MLGSRALFLKPWSAAVSEEKDLQSCIKHLTKKENCKRISEKKRIYKIVIRQLMKNSPILLCAITTFVV